MSALSHVGTATSESDFELIFFNSKLTETNADEMMWRFKEFQMIEVFLQF